MFGQFSSFVVVVTEVMVVAISACVRAFVRAVRCVRACVCVCVGVVGVGVGV